MVQGKSIKPMDQMYCLPRLLMNIVTARTSSIQIARDPSWKITADFKDNRFTSFGLVSKSLDIGLFLKVMGGVG